MDRVNCPILLDETRIEIVGDNRNLKRVPAKVMLNLSPVPRVIIDITYHHVSFVYLGIPSTVGHLLKIRTPSDAEIKVSIAECSINGRYKARLVPTQEPVTAIQTGDELQSVKFNVVNFPKFHCRLDTGDQTCMVQLRTSEWHIEIREVPEFSEVEKTLKKESGYGITHEGHIRRSDGELFSVEEAKKLLEGLHLFLSFARGAYCGITLISGNDKNGNKVWEQWGVYPTHPWFTIASWFDNWEGKTLSEVFPGFWKRFEKESDDGPVRVALYWYLISNEGDSLEAGIVLTQAALERLAYRIVGAKSGETGNWIGNALKKKKIDPKIPLSCQALEEFRSREDLCDGPHTLTVIRNHLMHSEKKRNIRVDDYSEAWDMGQRYVELLLLKLFEYDGPYINRLARKYEGKFESEMVPWAKDVQDTR